MSDQLRAFRGFSSITQAQPRGWLTSHALQISFNRRFRNGVSFGFNDAWLLSQTGSTAARIQHNPDGTFSERADQAQADELLGNFIPVKHNFKGNFVWDLPDIHSSDGALTDDWLPRERLAALRRVDRRDGRRLHRRHVVSERRATRT